MIVLHSLGCSRRFAQSPKNNEEITLSLTYMAKGDLEVNKLANIDMHSTHKINQRLFLVIVTA